MLKQVLLAVSVGILALSLSGCGSSTNTNVETKQTKGQQLMDLKEAYESGAISQEEYEELKERVLD